MADAIPVNSEPVRKGPKVKPVQVDANGVQLPADYVTVVRENLGSPADFRESDNRRELQSTLAKPDGTQHFHNYIREDF